MSKELTPKDIIYEFDIENMDARETLDPIDRKSVV